MRDMLAVFVAFLVIGVVKINGFAINSFSSLRKYNKVDTKLFQTSVFLKKISGRYATSKSLPIPSDVAVAVAKEIIFSSHQDSKDSNSYDANAITVLTGLEPVRKRPGMYIGNTGVKGLHHLLFEVLDNSIDESLAGHCDKIEVHLHNDNGVEVIDNGRGIPCSIHPATGKSSLETVLCVLHAGGKFGGESSGYSVSGGLHGVGISVVNALSEHLDIEVRRDNKIHTMSFSRGNVLKEMEVKDIPTDSSNQRGTRVRFRPDPQIFLKSVTSVESDGDSNREAAVTSSYSNHGLRLEYDRIARRIDELAYLYPSITISLVDHRPEATEDGSFDKGTEHVAARTKVFHHGGGIKELAKKLTSDKKPLLTNALNKGVNVTAISSSNSANSPLHTTTTTCTNPDLSNLYELSSDGTIYLKQDPTKTTSNPNGKGVVVEAAMRWSDDQYNEEVIGFVNGIRTIDGGSHIDGFKAGLTKAVNQYAKKMGKLKDGNIPGEYIREGLTGILSLKVPEPEFEGQTKTRLGNPEIRAVTDSAISELYSYFFDWYPDIFTAIYNKAIAAQNAAQAARSAREMIRKKSLLSNTILPGKLIDCSYSTSDLAQLRESNKTNTLLASNDPIEQYIHRNGTEIFLVEGDSAAGSAKLGRDRRFQAILPLRGKILNIEKTANEKIYQNAEIQALITSIGLGIRNSGEFDKAQLRYNRIIVMTDADVDGAHIRLLLLTFFYRYQRQLLEDGMVYIAVPPLYKVNLGRGASSNSGSKDKERYFYSQDEYDAYLKAATGSVSSQRFKGLGEMMPLQLWETTMNPLTRALRLVTVEDALEADSLTKVLMGDDVMPRKEFILKNVKDMVFSDLDI